MPGGWALTIDDPRYGDRGLRQVGRYHHLTVALWRPLERSQLIGVGQRAVQWQGQQLVCAWEGRGAVTGAEWRLTRGLVVGIRTRNVGEVTQ